MTKILYAALLTAATMLCVTGLGAQRAATPRRVPVTIVLTDSLPVGGGSFVIERRPHLTPGDVILLRPGADASQLSDAIRSMLTARQAGGDVATANATVRVRPHATTTAAERGAAARGRPASPAQAQRRAFPWAPRVLNDLRNADARDVAGIGKVRAVQVWLPPQRSGARRQGRAVAGR